MPTHYGQETGKAAQLKRRKTRRNKGTMPNQVTPPLGDTRRSFMTPRIKHGNQPTSNTNGGTAPKFEVGGGMVDFKGVGKGPKSGRWVGDPKSKKNPCQPATPRAA